MKYALFFLLSAITQIATAQQSDTTGKKLWQPYRITPRSGSQHVNLSGSGWQLSHTDKPVSVLSELKTAAKEPFQTSVPNSIHWSLFKAGKLPHPYAHKNSELYKWTDEKVWYYRKSFPTPANAAGNNAFLCFDGVDYFAKVWLNDSLVGQHEGMFGGPTVEIGRLLKSGGTNELVVEVRAGNWGNKSTDYESLPRNGSGERDYSKRTGYNPRASGRIVKPWVISGGSGGEAFFSVGMWQDVRLEIVPPYHLERPYLTTLSADAKQARLHLSCEVFAESHSLTYQLHPWNNTQIHHHDGRVPGTAAAPKNASVLIELVDDTGKIAFSTERPMTLFKGRVFLEEDLTIANRNGGDAAFRPPKLWNPNGLGDANLYQVRLSLKQDNKVLDRLDFTTGIRTIERVRTAGPRYSDRWENWQFVVNGRKLFVKGMNFTPQDVLLDLNRERYRWTLEAAKKMGVQLIRIWGGGLLESNHLYDLCNELGIMVWQDFPIGNQDTPGYPQDIWEAQVVQNIVRLRNHPSLAVWCGGNEFNPYSYGNAATLGILERNLDIFDKSRLYVRTTPDDGSIHTYPDMDPVWYGVGYRYEPWISETGMHSLPEAGLFRELVDNKEFSGLGKMWDKEFYKDHPEFIHHFTEYGPGRVPRMLSRASHITDVTDPTIESISEASQVGAGEFYQVFSEKVQGNYPVTAGLMPWVFKRHWPVIAIQLMDWFGHAGAPYYFLKRTYEPTHISLDIDRLLWNAGDKFPVKLSITHASDQPLTNGKATVRVLDKAFKPLWNKTQAVSLTAGPSVLKTVVGEMTIPADYRDQFFFVITELTDASGKLISRSTYWPRTTSKLDDAAFRQKYLTEPLTPWPTFEKGPFLKPTVAASDTKLLLTVLSERALDGNRSSLQVRVQNTGRIPAFMTQLDIAGAKRAIVASDNFFWLEPGETRNLTADMLWRANTGPEKPSGPVTVQVSAWNAPAVQQPLKMSHPTPTPPR
ncbi:glycoside hydrolase family 2 protein [Spirosoma areae]